MTDIKQTQVALERERDKAQQYLNIAGAMLVALDADGFITLINKKGCEILGYKESEITGKNWFDNFVPGQIKDELKMYFSGLRLDIKKTPENYTNSVVNKNGEEKIISWHNEVLRDDDGNFVGTLSSGEDITQQKAYERELQQAHEKISKYATELEQEVKGRTQELEEANKEMEAFSFTVAHDLRSPLRHINGFAELLRKKAGDSLNEDSLRYVQMISESANRLGRLIDDVLDFSKMKRAEMRRMPVNLRALIDSVKTELMHGTEDRNVKWEIDKLPMLEGDPSMLRVAFVNLLSNALKYTLPRKQAKINISFENHDNNSYIIKLEDNGVGFDMRYIEKIFGVFQRLHSDNEFEGTGIGLAVVQRIVHRHGGEIWAESEINKGSSFYIKLPKN